MSNYGIVRKNTFQVLSDCQNSATNLYDKIDECKTHGCCFFFYSGTFRSDHLSGLPTTVIMNITQLCIYNSRLENPLT